MKTGILAFAFLVIVLCAGALARAASFETIGRTASLSLGSASASRVPSSIAPASSSSNGDGGSSDIFLFHQISNLDALPQEAVISQARAQASRLLEGSAIDEKLHQSLQALCAHSWTFASTDLARAMTELVSDRYGRLLNASCSAKGGCFRAVWSSDISLIRSCARSAHRQITLSPASDEEKKIAKRELLKALVTGTTYSFDRNERYELANVMVHALVHEVYPEIPYREDARKVKGDLANLIDGTANAGFVDKLEGRQLNAEKVLEILGLK